MPGKCRDLASRLGTRSGGGGSVNTQNCKNSYSSVGIPNVPAQSSVFVCTPSERSLYLVLVCSLSRGTLRSDWRSRSCAGARVLVTPNTLVNRVSLGPTRIQLEELASPTSMQTRSMPPTAHDNGKIY